MTDGQILLTEADGVASVTLNRPDVMNAMGMEMARQLSQIVDEIKESSTIRAVIISSSGDKAFSAGADLKERKNMARKEKWAHSRLLAGTLARIAQLPQPVIAAVNGYALGGGCELALASDIRVVGTDATFGLTEVTIGVLPGAGGTQRLARLVGLGRAKDIILTGRQLSADEAYEIGLVEYLVEPCDVIPKAESLSEQISANAPLAVRQAKALLNASLDVGIDQGLQYEEAGIHHLFYSEDYEEGLSAFAEGRKPRFRGE